MIYLDKKIIEKKHTKIIYVQDAVTVQKCHIKFTVAHNEANGFLIKLCV